MVNMTEPNLLRPTGELCVLETCRHGSEGASWKSVLSLERITRWVATLLQPRAACWVGCPLSGDCGVSTVVLPVKGGVETLIWGVRAVLSYTH